MARQIVSPKSSLNSSFLAMCRQNPDATLIDLLQTLAKEEKITIEQCLERVTATVQEVRMVKDPDFTDPGISDEIPKMMARISSFLKTSKIEAGNEWKGATKTEIEKGVRPRDNLESYALEAAWQKMEDDNMITKGGGEKRGVRYDLAEG